MYSFALEFKMTYIYINTALKNSITFSPDVQSVDSKTALVVISSPMSVNATVCVSQILLFSTGGRACIEVNVM